MKSKGYVRKKLEQFSAQAQEDKAKWEKDHPGVLPGTNINRTWKSISKIRFPSRTFRRNYEAIDWNS